MMTKEDAEILIERGLSGKHAELGQIHNYLEYSIAEDLMRTVNKLSRFFKLTYNRLFNQYIKELKKSGKSLVDVLAVARNMSICEDYYKEEARLIETQLYEYEQKVQIFLFSDVEAY